MIDIGIVWGDLELMRGYFTMFSGSQNWRRMFIILFRRVENDQVKAVHAWKSLETSRKVSARLETAGHVTRQERPYADVAGADTDSSGSWTFSLCHILNAVLDIIWRHKTA